VAELEDEEAAGFEMVSGFWDELTVEFVAFFAAVEGGGGFVVTDFNGKRGGIFSSDVGWVGNDKIEGKWRVASGEWREGDKEIGFQECDAIRIAQAGSVALGYDQGRGGNVGGVDFGGGEFFCEGDGDATGAGADVYDSEAFTGEFGVAPGAEFADREAIEGDFDEVFGFGAGDQDAGSDFEFEAPEFLLASEMLGGFAGGAAVEKREVKLDGFWREKFCGVGVKPSAVVASHVEEKEFGGESVGGDVGFTEEVDPLFQGGADVEGSGV
jgi:hypothetical protein